MSMLDEIKARDTELHFCGTCNYRQYSTDDGTDPHNFDVAECERRIRSSNTDKIKPRQPDPETGRLCWNPEDHHPFVEGPIPDWMDAERDRRWLLEELELERNAF